MVDSVTRKTIEAFFAAYENQFNAALKNKADLGRISEFYSEAFIASNPAGVMTGENNDAFRTNMGEGYEYYRSIGTARMKCDGVEITELGDSHAVAHVMWQALYLKNGEEILIPFENHYFLHMKDNSPVIFGWVSGDESALLEEKGII
ncbi:hypothetical protein [Salinicoccus halodurans]|uniref:DUF4440 domain-containing protein n=1 Tax=Salinicoccus halodurans TaxID=407035 RepID=A0A0F7D441_9STAP|nr:hypothetical protein [Salinicoccus halodurans]AKG73575.1 hypothetical protein AAT16_04710 [Salinicoccus halodurans]SFK52817.1 hypothetical protein SAMN05216235_0178 [Salinicoccus halodurans]